LLLGVFAGTHILSYALAMGISIWRPSFIGAVLGAWVVKILLQQIVNHKLMGLLNEKDLWWRFPLLDIATFVYYVTMTPYLFLKSKTTWS